MPEILQKAVVLVVDVGRFPKLNAREGARPWKPISRTVASRCEPTLINGYDVIAISISYIICVMNDTVCVKYDILLLELFIYVGLNDLIYYPVSCCDTSYIIEDLGLPVASTAFRSFLKLYPTHQKALRLKAVSKRPLD